MLFTNKSGSDSTSLCILTKFWLQAKLPFCFLCNGLYMSHHTISFSPLVCHLQLDACICSFAAWNFLKGGKCNLNFCGKIDIQQTFFELLNGDNISFNLFTKYVWSFFLGTSILLETWGYSSDQNRHCPHLTFSKSIHVSVNGNISFFFLWLNKAPLCIYNTPSLSIHLLVDT